MPNNFSSINGTGQDDNLLGTIAWEIIHGRGGDDTIEGGGGLDYLYGGRGSDAFVIRADTNNDVIFDYDRTEGDTILLDVNGAITFPSGNLSDGQTFTDNGVTITVATVDEPATDGLDTRITVDVNGDAIIDHQDVILVILGYAPSDLTSADFM